MGLLIPMPGEVTSGMFNDSGFSQQRDTHLSVSVSNSLPLLVSCNMTVLPLVNLIWQYDSR